MSRPRRARGVRGVAPITAMFVEGSGDEKRARVPPLIGSGGWAGTVPGQEDSEKSVTRRSKRKYVEGSAGSDGDACLVPFPDRALGLFRYGRRFWIRNVFPVILVHLANGPKD